MGNVQGYFGSCCCLRKRDTIGGRCKQQHNVSYDAKALQEQAITPSCPLCTCDNTTSKAIKYAFVSRVSPAHLDMIDESQSLYFFSSLVDSDILSSYFSCSYLIIRIVFLKLNSARLYWPKNTLTSDAKMNSEHPDSHRYQGWESHLKRHHAFWVSLQRTYPGGLSGTFLYLHPKPKELMATV